MLLTYIISFKKGILFIKLDDFLLLSFKVQIFLFDIFL